jgi:arylsulfatase
VFLVVSPQAIVAEFLQTFVDYPPRMKAASFPIDQVQGKLESAIACGR